MRRNCSGTALDPYTSTVLNCIAVFLSNPLGLLSIASRYTFGQTPTRPLTYNVKKAGFGCLFFKLFRQLCLFMLAVFPKESLSVEKNFSLPPKFRQQRKQRTWLTMLLIRKFSLPFAGGHRYNNMLIAMIGCNLLLRTTLS